MITIIKDNSKIKCSQNTYETMYKRLGYTILEEPKKIEKKEEPKKEIEQPKEVITKKAKEGKTTKGKNKKGE